MPLLTVTNLTTSPITLQEPTGLYSGLVILVPASGAVTNKYVLLAELASLEPLLIAEVAAGKISWSSAVDPAHETDQTPAHVKTVLVTPYNAVAGDQYILTNLTIADAVSVVLSAAAPIGQYVEVIDAKGDAATHNVTVTVASSGTINGGSSAVISTNSGNVKLLKTGTNAWLTV